MTTTPSVMVGVQNGLSKHRHTSLSDDFTLVHIRKLYGIQHVSAFPPWIAGLTWTCLFFPHLGHGKLMLSLRSDAESTPAQVKLNGLAGRIAALGAAADPRHSRHCEYHLIDRVIVVAVLEGLPLAIALALALATRRITKQNLHVRLLGSVVLGLPRKAAINVITKDGDREIFVKAGNRLVIDTSKAHLDPKVFPDPYKLNPRRPRKDYIMLGAGLHFCFGARLVGPAIAGMIKEISKLPDLEAAQHPSRPGPPQQFYGFSTHLYLDSFCRESPIPTSFVIEFDSDVPVGKAASRPSYAMPSTTHHEASPGPYANTE
ncbi:hypothetical protein V8E36_006775 [Tilletia maclaganii]